MNDITKIIKSLEDSGVLIDGVTKTEKHEIKKQKGGFLGVLLGPLAASLVQSVISSVVKGISGRGVRRAGRGYMITGCASISAFALLVTIHLGIKLGFILGI